METQTATERHNAYAFVRPDATACYLCGRKEFTTPVEGFQVRDCDKCDRPVCERCAEIDCGGEGEGVQWQCEQGCLIDVRVPITVTFDFSILNVKPDEVEAAITRLCGAVITAKIESLVAREFETDDEELASGTRWDNASADMDSVGVRTHAQSGGFSPWVRETAEVNR